MPFEGVQIQVEEQFALLLLGYRGAIAAAAGTRIPSGLGGDARHRLELRLGVPGASAGLNIAARLGLAPDIITAARAQMTTQTADIGAFLDFWRANPDFDFYLAATPNGDVVDRRGLIFGGAGKGKDAK